MATVQEIPFQSIPHQSSLFLNYADLSPSALRFYQNAPTMDSLQNVARNLSERRFRRSEIVSILRRQNEAFGCDSRTLGQIDALEEADCAAILTGQQVGIFASPLYTIYKALTAIHIAEALKQRGIRAVPIFWMETEDHDLPEVTHRTFLNPQSSIQSIDYRETLFGKSRDPQGAVGSIAFPESIREVVRDFLDRIPDTPWKLEIRQQLEAAYKPGSTFALAFAQLLARLFRGLGLILFDPHDAEAKRLESAVFQHALRDSDNFRQALLQRNRELESAGFHSQVSILENSTVLFYFDAGMRWALERKETGFALKNGGRTFSLDTLLECAEQTPEKFSPNVLLRPLIQDSLFPTIAYVGGAAEVAYFSQIEVLYRLTGRPMPVIWPRDSFTLIEPHIAAEMDRLQVDIRDCFQGKQFLLEKALHGSGCSEAASCLEDLDRHLDQVLTDIRPEMQVVDPTLMRALETARRKMLHNIQRLKSRVTRIETTRNSFLPDTADLLTNNCLPNGVLQERELDIHHFLARYGPSVLEQIRASLKIGAFSHHVLYLHDRGAEELRDKGIEG